ncbi:hypothetical protein FOZ62_022853 [Perkinsus olseni]|uniref:Uncharacterized protein n=1 Tax=Perkinsus olseni TaxID=32597 RepID=A0A7J6S7I4_PEROL|nr:hypothetical protein FOZ62_022853 [Perkinsus olseni]
MINFIPSWLFVTLPTVIHAAPVVGWFIHYAKDYHMYFTVDLNQTAFVHTIYFNAYTRRGPGITPRTRDLHHPTHINDFDGGIDLGFPLTKVTDNVSSIGFPPDVLREWYARIANSLYLAGHVDSKDGFPPAGIQPGDLVTITQTSGDTYTTNFRGETIKFMRRSGDLKYLTSGFFEYEEPVAPHLKLSVYVRYDKTRRGVDLGLVEDTKKPYQRYNVEPAGRGTFDQFIQMVRYVCPTKRLQPVDLTNIVIGRPYTIYVPFEGGRMALTRVE